jgi:L-aminopeptidase/D-esterase-like protein
MFSIFKIGHFTDKTNGTGCTVILPSEENVSSASARGASPGTREIALLSPDKKISRINALLLTGGSAFGLGAAQGIMDRMVEQDIGYFTEFGLVPIVPAAVIFDKNVGNPAAYPKPEDARMALLNAKLNNDVNGCIGAGTGATVGKWNGMPTAMKGGFGTAQFEQAKIKVAAVSVVNSVGDILNFDGSILAGAIDEDNFFLAETGTVVYKKPRTGLADNTVLTAVLTNARLTKQQAFYVAERAHFGIARRVQPSHTSYDGDLAFTISSPEIEGDIDLVASLAVRAVEYSIVNAVTSAESMFGLKSVSQINKV